MASPRRFLIVGMQRSGTTVTWSQLRQHPDVALFDDELHASFFATAIRDRTADGETREQRTASLRTVVDRLANPGPTTRASGLKTALGSAEQTARLVGCLLTHGSDFFVIAIRRRDLVAQLGSLRRAMVSGQWHRPAANAPSTTRRLRIEEAELVDYVHQCIDSQRLLEQLADHHRMLWIDYDDDIVTGRDWGRICELLELPVIARPAAKLTKVAPPAVDYIQDYPRLQQVMATAVQRRHEQPPPMPVFDPAPSRLFVLHRAWAALDDGDHAGVIHDALAAFEGRAEWGVTTNEWATQLIRDALFREHDAALAAATVARLQRDWPEDPHVQALLARIATWPHARRG